jgi:hypothetical protein
MEKPGLKPGCKFKKPFAAQPFSAVVLNSINLGSAATFDCLTKY